MLHSEQSVWILGRREREEKESKLSGSIWDVFEKIPKRIFH